MLFILLRAYETAAAVTDALGLAKPEKLDLLIERNFGIMTGESVNNIELKCSPNIIKTNTVTYFLSPENAETFPQLIARSQKLFAWIAGQNFSKDILLVTHGDIGKMIYAAYYNLPWADVLTNFHLGNTDVLLLDKNTALENRHIVKVEQYNS